MYYVEATFNQGSQRELGYEKECATLQEAIDQINHWAQGQSMCRAWINNKEVRVQGCHVVGSDREPFCTNPGWHRTFAPYDYPQILERAPRELVKHDPEVDAVNRVFHERALQAKAFRPESMRGTAPTNPATRIAIGKDGE